MLIETLGWPWHRQDLPHLACTDLLDNPDLAGHKDSVFLDNQGTLAILKALFFSRIINLHSGGLPWVSLSKCASRAPDGTVFCWESTSPSTVAIILLLDCEKKFLCLKWKITENGLF